MFLRIIISIFAVAVVVVIGVKFEFSPFENYLDIKLVALIVGLVFLWPLFKLIEIIEKLIKDKKSKYHKAGKDP